MKNTIFGTMVLAFAMLLIAGCNSQPHPKEMPRLYPVTITITQENTPLEGASVVLHPQDESMKRWAANGFTDKNGTAVLKTLSRYPGVVPGKCKVVISKIERDPSTFVGKPTFDRADEYDQAELKRKSYRIVDRTFDDVATTPLEIEIGREKKKQSFDVGKPIHEFIPASK